MTCPRGRDPFAASPAPAPGTRRVDLRLCDDGVYRGTYALPWAPYRPRTSESPRGL